MKHIKGQLRQGESFECDIYDELEHVATCLGKTPLAEQRAAEIVTAVNAYDALVEALQAHKAVSDHVQACSRCGDGRECNTFNGLAHTAAELTRVALEAAGATD